MNKNEEGFTLIELLFGIAILMILMTVIYGFLHDFSQKSYLVDIQTKATSNLSVLNNTVSWLIKNWYGVDYSSIDTWSDLDRLVLYSDKIEQNKITLYVRQDLDRDISRLIMEKWWVEYFLHSTSLFIEKFNIDMSPKPVWVLADIQPWVSVDFLARSRSPLEEPTDDIYYDMYNKSEVSLKWRWLVRNYVPSSLKN